MSQVKWKVHIIYIVLLGEFISDGTMFPNSCVRVLWQMEYKTCRSVTS